MRVFFLSFLLLTACGASPGTHDAGVDAAVPADASPSDANPSDAWMCSTENMHCVVRDDCCNSRHSCLRGVCLY